VTVLQTTDLHDHARGPGTLSRTAPAEGGYARIAAYVGQVRASAGHPVLLVDSGDWSMGTLYDLTLERRPLALRFVQALGYDCITLGNHEFDYGPAGLAGILEAAARDSVLDTPIVASNLELGGDPDLAPFLGEGKPIRRTLVRTLANGLRVGFLGLMGRDAASLAPAAAPVRFTDYARDYTAVQGLVDELRNRRHCRLVIALDHAGTDVAGTGGEDVDLARHVTGIDLIASGHAHNPLDSARTVTAAGWTTLICCAGAYGTNVSRLDLVCGADGGVVLEASSNRPMTDAGLAGLGIPRPDPACGALLGAADLELNRALAPVFARVARFGDYVPEDPTRGIFHPVGASARALPADDRAALLGPSGLGNFCADAFRAVSNALQSRGGPACADPTPFTAAVVPRGELRNGLAAGRAFTFADLYGVMPLGLSPDPAQDDATGEPLVGAYLDPDGLRELCAMQLLAQTGLVGADYYLHLSGLSYGLKPAETGDLFAAAGAASALALATQRAGAGSMPARWALAGLAQLPADRGAALLAAAAAGNPFAGAMVRLTDPDPAQVPAHLALLGRVAAAAARDAATGATTLDALLLAQAMAAIGPMSAFAATDPACTGPAAPLGPGRCRIVLDRYALLMVDGIRSRFGLRTAVYQAARGDALLTGATPDGRERILANRIALEGGTFRELKTWTALLLYLTAPPGRGGHFDGGRITAEYGATPDFSRFPVFGAAVRVRNAAFPAAQVLALAALVQGLRGAS
jgi:2',3'-cyclic-nucleotide 2'-phosphodiesterase (5'-nucleotidase family)